MLKDNLKKYNNKTENGSIMEATNTCSYRALRPLMDVTNWVGIFLLQENYTRFSFICVKENRKWSQLISRQLNMYFEY